MKKRLPLWAKSQCCDLITWLKMTNQSLTGEKSRDREIWVLKSTRHRQVLQEKQVSWVRARLPQKGDAQEI